MSEVTILPTLIAALQDLDCCSRCILKFVTLDVTEALQDFIHAEEKLVCIYHIIYFNYFTILF